MSTFSQNVPTEPKIVHLFVDQFSALLSSPSNTTTFLNYTQSNCINFLSLYDLQSIGLPSSYNTLGNFIDNAKTNYGVCDVSGSVDLFNVATDGMNRPNLLVNYNQLVGTPSKQITWFTLENEYWNLSSVSQTIYNTCTTNAGSDTVVLNGVNAGSSPLIVSNIILINATGEYRQIKEILGGGTSIRVDRPIVNNSTNSSFTVFNVLGSAYQLDFTTFLHRLKLLRTYANQYGIKLEAYLPRKGSDQEYYKLAPFLDRILLEEEQNSVEYAVYNRYSNPTSVNRRVRQILEATTAFRSGTITVNGSTIQGTGTNFIEDLAVGTSITVAGQKFTIASINGSQATTTIAANPNITTPSQFRTFVNIAPIFYINLSNAASWLNTPSNSKTFIDLYKYHALSNYVIGSQPKIGVSPLSYQDEYLPGITGSTSIDGISIFARTFAQGSNGTGVKTPTNPCSTCGAPGTVFTLNTPTSTDTTCDNAQNGSITVSFNSTNLTSPFKYNFIGPSNTIQITNPNDSFTFSGCTSGLWSVFVEDNTGLVSNTVSNISISETFQPTISSNNSGTASISLLGGITPYYVIENSNGFFALENSDGTYNYTGFTPGTTYTFIVGDNDSCWKNLVVTIASGGTSLPITISTVNPTCDNALNGVININVNGTSTSPYAYFIDNGINYYNFNSQQPSYSFSGAISGTWNVHVLDSTTPTQLTSSTISTVLSQTFNVSVLNTGFESVCFRLTGGTLPYYIHDTNNTFFKTVNSHGIHCFNIPCGIYAFTIGDNYGCNTLLSPVTILCAGITLSLLSSEDTQCGDFCLGSITVAANNGTYPYTYSATNGTTTYINTSGVFNGLCAGSWTLSSVDSTGIMSNTITTTINNNFQATAYTLNNQICVYASGSILNNYNLTIGGQPHQYTGGTISCYPVTACGDINVSLNDGGSGSTFNMPLVILNSFYGTTTGDAAIAKSGLIELSNGLMYGLSQIGGTNNFGTIYSYDKNTNIRTILHNFSGTTIDGKNPYGQLIQATNSLLYGLTNSGGLYDLGTLFSFDITSNTVTILHNFSGGTIDGSNPKGNVMQASDGNLYGTTNSGGNGTYGQWGVIFKYNPTTSQYSIVHNFNGGPDARACEGDLVEADNGKLYGLCPFGRTGCAGMGTIYSFDPNTNIESIVHCFGDITTDGTFPRYSMMKATNGLLYGVTLNGGGTGYNGVLFSFNTTSNTETVLYRFNPLIEGSQPRNTPIEGTDGNIYLTLSQGGAFNGGSLFRYNISTSAGTVLHVFTTSNDGGNGSGNLLQSINGLLYGTNSLGGLNNLGVMYSYDITPQNNNIIYSKLYSFSGTTMSPGFSEGDLLESSDGNLYGLSVLGGLYNHGTIFKYEIPTNVVTILHNFSGTTDGKYPHGSLLEATDGNLYGLTELGGVNDLGTIFKYDKTNSATTIVYSFSGTPIDGSTPFGDLIQATNGLLYGLTYSGGVLNLGTIFSYDISTNTVQSKYHFSGGTNSGSQAKASLVQASNFLLYGTTTKGGPYNAGTIFLYDIAFNVTNIVTYFSTFGSDGKTPKSTLIEGSDGLLYGTTHDGGVTYSGGYGTLFSLNPTTTTKTTLAAFDGIGTGKYPHGKVLQGSDNLLYILLEQGGLYDRGAIFVYNTLSEGINIHSFSAITGDGIYPAGSLIQVNNDKFYGLTSRGGDYINPNDGGIIFSFDLSSSAICSYNTSVYVDCSFNILTTSTPITCLGLKNGSILVTNVGGTSPYSYTAVNGSYIYTSNSNPATFTNLHGGLWTIYGSDDLGNLASTTINLYPSLMWRSNITSLSLTESEVCVSISGGTLPYFITLGNTIYTGLTADTIYCYTIPCGQPTLLSVRDYNYCTIFRQSLLVPQCSIPLNLDVSITNPYCSNSDGIIYLSGTGGSSVYNSYSAYNNTNTYISYLPSGIFTGLTSGIWNVGVTDSNGDTVLQTISLFPPSVTPVVTGTWLLGPAINVNISSTTNASYTITVGGNTYNYTTTPEIISTTGCGITTVTINSLESRYSKLDDMDNDYSNPSGALTQPNNGIMYGACLNSGPGLVGTLFSYDITANTTTLLLDFSILSEGEYPNSNMILIDDRLYGTTLSDFLFNGNGTLYSIELSSNTYTTLHPFELSTSGTLPMDSPIQATNQKLYGVTNEGGLYNYGTLYSYEISSSTITVLHNFSLNDQQPKWTPIQASNGLLYGVTRLNMNLTGGTLYSYDIATNIYTKLYDFNILSGHIPSSRLLEVNGSLYGTTNLGGTGGVGTIYRYEISSNTLTNIYSFIAFGLFVNPVGNIVYHNGSIFGMTPICSGSVTPPCFGAIYAFNLNTNRISEVHIFSGSPVDGANAFNGLIKTNDDIIYGTTGFGGINDLGIIFQLSPLECSYNIDVDIPCTEPLSISATSTDVTCNVDNSGVINLEAYGGSPSYMWELTNGINYYSGQTTSEYEIISFTGLTASVWTITATDISGNTASIIQYLSNLTVDITNISGDTICISISDGTPPYQISLNNVNIGVINSTPVEVCYTASCGTNLISVVDFVGCDYEELFSFSCPSLLLSHTQSNSFCDSGNGSIRLIASGGSGNYIYTLTNGQITYTSTTTGIFSIPVGSWIGTVIDSLGNSLSTSVIDILYDFYSLITPVFNGVYITFTGSESTSIYVDGSYMGNYSNGTHFIALSCNVNHLIKIIGKINLDSPPGIQCIVEETIFIPCGLFQLINVNYINPSCYSSSDGSITASISGGSPQYTYQITNPSLGVGQSVTTSATTYTFNGLSVGQWILTIADNNGSSTQQIINLVSAFQANVNLFSNGYTLNVSGGTQPYSLYFDGVLITNQLINGSHTYSASCGEHTIVVNEPFGPSLCPYSFKVDIPCSPPTLTVSYTNPSCGDNSNGTIIALANGGLPSYTYSVTNGSITLTNTSGIFNNIGSGTWTITAIDSSPNPTPVTTTITLLGTYFITVTSIVNNICVDINGGLPPYNIYVDGILKLLSTNQTSHCFTASCGTNHTIMVLDSTPPCTTFVNSQMVTNTNFESCSGWTITAGSNVDPLTGLTCSTGSVIYRGTLYGNNYTTITLSQPYTYPTLPTSITYAWQYSTGGGHYPLISGGSIYSLISIGDGYGNISQMTPNSFASAPYTSYSGTVTFTNATGFTLQNNLIRFIPAFSPSVVNNFNEYTHISAQLVNYTSACPCTASGSTSVICPEPLSLTLISYTNPDCDNVCDGIISVSGYGGTYPYTYSATNGTTTYINTSGIFSGLCADIWYLYVIDSVSEIETSITPITLNNAFYALISNYGNGYCVTITGGTQPYYVFNNGVPLTWDNNNITNCYPPISGCGITSVITVRDST